MTVPSWSSEDDAMVHDFPSAPRKTKIRRLRYLLRARQDETGDDHPIVDLIRHSPDLEQVSVRYSGGMADELQALLAALSQLERLQDVHLPHSVYAFHRCTQDLQGGFMELKRLALDDNIELCVLDDLPSNLPSLETIHIDSAVANKRELNARTRFPEHQPLTSMVSHARHTYRTCPQLANIYTSVHPNVDVTTDIFAHFDDIEASGRNQTGYIRSLRHGEDEVFHARNFMHFAETADVDLDSDDYPRSQPYVEVIEYVAADGSDRKKVYEERKEGAFHESTDYGGLLVPLEILQEMRRVDKAPLGSWEGRGIDVGDEAWQVLLDWKKRQEVDGVGAEGS